MGCEYSAQGTEQSQHDEEVEHRDALLCLGEAMTVGAGDNNVVDESRRRRIKRVNGGACLRRVVCVFHINREIAIIFILSLPFIPSLRILLQTCNTHIRPCLVPLYRVLVHDVRV